MVTTITIIHGNDRYSIREGPFSYNWRHASYSSIDDDYDDDDDNDDREAYKFSFINLKSSKIVGYSIYGSKQTLKIIYGSKLRWGLLPLRGNPREVL